MAHIGATLTLSISLRLLVIAVQMIFRREQTLLCHVPCVKPFLTLRHDFYSRHPVCWKHQTCSILGRRPSHLPPHHPMRDDIYCVQAWTCEGCPQPSTVNVYLPQQPPPPRAASQHLLAKPLGKMRPNDILTCRTKALVTFLLYLHCHCLVDLTCL